MLKIVVALPPGASGPGGLNLAQRFVLSAPVISQDLSLVSRGEQLDVEELIPEHPLNDSVKPFSHRHPGLI